VYSASRTPFGDAHKYRVMQNPPKDCPNKVHFVSAPNTVCRIHSASATMESDLW
jgi:hypothetical protein